MANKALLFLVPSACEGAGSLAGPFCRTALAVVFATALSFGAPSAAVAQTGDLEKAKTFEVQIIDVLSEYRKAKEDLTSAVKLLDARSAALESKKKEIADLEAQQTDLTQKIQEIKDKPVAGAKELREQIENMEKGIDTIKGQIALERDPNKKKELEAKLQQGIDDRDTSQGQLDVLEADKLAEIKELEVKLAQVNNNLIAVNEEVAELIVEVDTAMAAVKGAQKALGSVKTEGTVIAGSACPIHMTLATQEVLSNIYDMLQMMELACPG